jgi:transposase
VWWSRLAQPEQHGWRDQPTPLRLQELQRPKTDRPVQPEQMLLRFVTGRPVSAVTTDFLAWCSTRLAAQGVTALLLGWDNASWHKSQAIRAWLRQHNQQVKRTGHGVRIVSCWLPIKSPWLNPIEPKWVHGKRAVSEPDRLLSADEVEARVCAYYRCAREAHLIMPKKVA